MRSLRSPLFPLVFVALLFAIPASAVVTEVASDVEVHYMPMGATDKVVLRSSAIFARLSDEMGFMLMGQATQTMPADTVVYLPHQLVNRSARTMSFNLAAENQFVDDYDLTELHLFRDVDGNGRIEATDPAIALTDAVTLAPGEKINLLIRGRVPAATPAQHTAMVAVAARDLATSAMMIRVNAVQVRERPPGAGLLVEKSASRNEAEIGETIDYAVRVRNVADLSLAAAQLLDDLPTGFTYERGSLRFDHRRLPDPAGASGSHLAFDLGELAPGASLTVHYRARLGAGALHSDGINRARALAAGYESNTATARVQVRPGVFTSKGVVIGRVFLDTNDNALLDTDEPGIPGVRVYLEDGTYAVTDADGKYSFYGLTPRTHIVKLDTTTLPEGAKLALVSHAQARDAASRFVDLKRSELHKANFALTAASLEVREEIETRRAALRQPGAEIARELQGRLTADGLPSPLADPKALPSSGLVNDQADSERWGGLTPRRSERVEVNALHLDPPAADDLLASIADHHLGFVGLHDGSVLPVAQTDVLVKGTLGASFSLAVNGAIVGEDQIGTKATVPDRQIEAWNFVGVNLAPGDNRLRVTMSDAFGNERGSETIAVRAPGALAYIKITASDAVADGVTPARVTIELLDARTTPVTARTPLTLEANMPSEALAKEGRVRWQVEDLDPATEGVQVFVEGGKQTFALIPPLDPGECDLIASSGVVRHESSLTFQPNLRPLLAAGVVEGAINFGARARGALTPADARDAFAEELRGLSAGAHAGQLGAGARAAFFLKGKVRGDALLTAAYDSDKDTRERLFRDIQPGEFYPVYGDASTRGYDAQSTGKLYVRLDKNRSYALLGDFTTQSAPAGTDSPRALGDYQRSFTGAKEHYETDRVRANLWASQDSTRQVVAEITANGTSGPYVFSGGDGIAGSERVELLTRDRDQPSRIIATKTVARFFDYEFEPFTGRLLFKAPVASLDENLNPVSIRITYEVDQGGKKFWVYGGDAQVKLTERLELAGGYARDENPEARYELASAGATWKLASQTTLTGEVAASRSEIDGDGLAERIEFKHRDARSDARVYLGRTDENFRNPGSILLPGRVEGGFKAAYKLTGSTSLLAQGLLTEDVRTGGRREGVRVDVERAFGPYRLALGARYSREKGPDEANSIRAKFTAPIPRLAGATGYLEYERDIHSSDKQLAAAGFDYAFASGGRAYARHEFISSLGGAFELNNDRRNRTTVVGFEHGYMQGGKIFNEYRAANEIYGRESEAALGLRNLWKLADGVRANTSFERVTPFAGDKRNESTALTGAIDYARDSRWRANARLEFRASPSTDSVLNTLGYARLLDADWTFLGKTIALLTRAKGPASGDMVQARAQTGFAWRPARADRWNALGKYELKYESDSRATALVAQRLTHIVSGDVNYQPNAAWVVSAHYAGKWVREKTDLGRGDAFAHLVGARFSREFSRRWDTALNVSTLFNGDGSQRRVAIGPEVGVLLGKNLQLGFGFNVVGFHDRDLATDNTTARGAFLRLRLKFDEQLFHGSGQK